MKHLALLTAVAFMAACDTSAEPPPDPPYPVVTILTPIPEIRAPGEASVVEYSVRNPDGTVPEHYQFSMLQPDANWAVTMTTVAPGHERVSIVAREGVGPYFFPYVMVRVCVPFDGDPCAGRSDVTAPFAYIVVAGGYAREVVAPFPEMALEVGERRPVLAFAGTAAATFATTPLTYSSGQPGVATVGATSGEVIGVSRGVARLQVSAGAGAADVMVTVTEGDLGPPPATATLSGPFFFLPKVGLQGRMAVDGRGYPMFGLELVPTFAGSGSAGRTTAALARWTGSGWGRERVSAAADPAANVGVTVDADDHLWVIYQSGLLKTAIVADRAATDPPGQWRRRLLSPEISAVTAAGHHYLDPNVYAGVQHLAITPRPGGGAWVAFRTYAAKIQSVEYNCAYATVLAEVTEAEVQLSEHDLALVKQDGVVAESCPPDPGGFDVGLQLVEQEAGPPLALPGERGTVIPSPAWRAQTFGGEPLPGVDTVPEAGMFAFEAGHNLFYGDTEATWLGCYSASGFDCTQQLLDGADDQLRREIRRGWAVDGRTFYQLLAPELRGGHTLHVTSVLLDDLPPTDAPEAAGAWLALDPTWGAVAFPPVVMPSGERLIQTFATDGLATSSGHVWRSAGPDQPFAAVADVNWDTFAPASPMFEAGGRLYALRNDHRLYRSADGGATWGFFGNVSPAANGLGAGHFFADGRALLFFVAAVGTLGKTELLFSADVEAGRPFSPVVTLPGVKVLDVAAREAAGIYPDGDQAWVLNWDGEFYPPHLQARLIDVGGDVVAEHEVELPEYTNPGMGARLGSGAFVMLQAVLHPVLPTPFALTFVSWDPADDAVDSVVVDAAERYVSCQPPVTLADGRAAAACTREEGPGVLRAIYTTTTDGRTWTEPVVLRPDGGRTQRALGAAAEPDGALFILLTDGTVPLVMRVVAP